MIEFAGFGFAVMVWWTWPVLFAVTMAAVYTACRLSQWQDDRAHHKGAVHQCAEYVGEERGMWFWCALPCGHGGEHMDEGTLLSGVIPHQREGE